MTGYDEAREWVEANAPDWVIVRSDAALSAGSFVGAPTESRYTVELAEAREWRIRGVTNVMLTGEGRTLLEAVQNAVGDIRAADAIA